MCKVSTFDVKMPLGAGSVVTSNIRSSYGRVKNLIASLTAHGKRPDTYDSFQNYTFDSRQLAKVPEPSPLLIFEGFPSIWASRRSRQIFPSKCRRPNPERTRPISLHLSNVATAVQALFGIVVTVAIPYMINPDQANIRGKLGFFFGGLSLISLAWSYFRLSETMGRTYEELDLMFEKDVKTREFKL